MSVREALPGLVGAARALGDAVDRGDSYRVLAEALAQTRAALAAWSKRGRLRDDAELRGWLSRELLIPYGDAGLDVVLDHIEAHLFGGEPKP